MTFNLKNSEVCCKNKALNQTLFVNHLVEVKEVEVEVKSKPRNMRGRSLGCALSNPIYRWHWRIIQWSVKGKKLNEYSFSSSDEGNSTPRNLLLL
jgi:hypothetical protein